jgi:hypothetical protein
MQCVLQPSHSPATFRALSKHTIAAHQTTRGTPTPKKHAPFPQATHRQTHLSAAWAMVWMGTADTSDATLATPFHHTLPHPPSTISPHTPITPCHHHPTTHSHHTLSPPPLHHTPASHTHLSAPVPWSGWAQQTLTTTPPPHRPIVLCHTLPPPPHHTLPPHTHTTTPSHTPSTYSHHQPITCFHNTIPPPPHHPLPPHMHLRAACNTQATQHPTLT